MTRHPSTPTHRPHRTPLEDTDPDFDRLKELSTEYWSLVNGDEEAELPSLDAAYGSMWEEAIDQTRKGWEARRYAWTALVADLVRCTPTHLTRRAGEGWDGDVIEVVREMMSSPNRTRSVSGTWAAVEPTEEERAQLAELTRRAAAYWTPADKAEETRKAMVAEAVRLVHDGQKRGVYGQTAAVARVTGWTREHCSRLARKARKKTAQKPGRRGQRRTPAAA